MAKSVAVTRNALNVNLDSVVTQYTYNANKTIAEIEETALEEGAGVTGHITSITNLSYTGSLISGLTGSSMDTSVYPGIGTGYTNTQTTTTYVASGSRIVSYVERNTETITFPGTRKSTRNPVIAHWSPTMEMDGYPAILFIRAPIIRPLPYLIQKPLPTAVVT